LRLHIAVSNSGKDLPMPIGLAFRLFFKALGGDAAFVEGAQRLLENRLPAPAATTVTPAPSPAAPAKPAAPPKPARSDALNLLALLQREGRLIDFLKEDIAPYSDAQIGAAVRDVHRDTRAALDRCFALAPLRTEAEGTPVDVPANLDATAFRLTGNVAGPGPYKGTLRHAGWKAEKVELPEYTGPDPASRIVAPAEIELS
jgi:hypothetical protein